MLYVHAVFTEDRGLQAADLFDTVCARSVCRTYQHIYLPAQHQASSARYQTERGVCGWCLRCNYLLQEQGHFFTMRVMRSGEGSEGDGDVPLQWRRSAVRRVPVVCGPVQPQDHEERLRAGGGTAALEGTE